MKKNRLFIFLAIDILFCVIFSLVYILQVGAIVNSKARNNVYHNTVETMNYLDSYVETNYKDLDFRLTNTTKTKNEICNDLYDELSSKGFEGFGYYGDTDLIYYNGARNYLHFRFNDMNAPMQANRALGEKVVVVKASHIFDDVRDDETIIFYNFKKDEETTHFFAVQSFANFASLLSSAFEDVNKHYIILSNDAFIYENTYNNAIYLNYAFENNLSNIPDNVEDLIKDIYTDETKTQMYTLSNNKQYIVATHELLRDYNSFELSIIFLVETKYLNAFSKSLTASTLVFIGFIVIVVSIFTLAIYTNYRFLKNTRKNKLAMIPFSDDLHYIILINDVGRVITKNKKFIDSIFNCNNILDNGVVEITDKRALKDFLNNSASLTLMPNSEQEDPHYIKFIIIKLLLGYQLVGLDTNDKPYVPKVTMAAMETKEGSISIEQAYQDEVYGILNRKALFDEIDEIILEKAKNSKDVYMFMAGLRNREEVERTYGRKYNELTNFGIINELKDKLGLAKIYVMDSDYFVFFLKLKDNYQALTKKLEEINTIFKKPIRVLANEMQVELMFGIYPFSIYDPSNMSINPKSIIEDLLYAYDKAKQLKDRNYYLYDKSSQQIIEKELQISKDIENAIKNNEFVTYFQPVYSLKRNKVAGFECLLRWDNDKYRYESPFEYIKVAERICFINSIGFITFEESFKLLKELNDPSLHISVNVSPAQFQQIGFSQKFLDLFKQYEINYDQVAIEITETFLIESMQDIIDKLNQLRGYGIKVYLDDFGTGYSSLLYLAELPIDVIKIDKEFTAQITTSKQVRGIISHILGIADELDMEIVAEGVETDKQIQFLEKQGCDYLQGYYFSKPVPKSMIKETLKIIRKEN